VVLVVVYSIAILGAFHQIGLLGRVYKRRVLTILGGLDSGLCYKNALVGLNTSTPTKLTSTHFNQIFLVVGLSAIGNADDVLSIIFKQSTSNTISQIWNKGGIQLTISDQTGYLNVKSRSDNTSCMVLSNFQFTVG